MLASPEEALAAIARHAKVPGLAFGSDRICSVDLGKDLWIEIEDKAEDATIRFHAALGYAGDLGVNALHFLLEANFNGNRTGRAALAINPASDDVTLGQAVDPRHFTADTFFAEFETFARVALFWHGQLRDLPKDSVADDIVDTDETINLRL